MKLTPHSARDYAEALKNLLPPGAAWRWPAGGFGDALLLGCAKEMARIDVGMQQVLDAAIARHLPKYGDWSLRGYQSVADAAVGVGVATVDAPFSTSRVGMRIGGRVSSERSGYILRVRYHGDAAVRAALASALDAFKQAHIWIWLEAI